MLCSDSFYVPIDRIFERTNLSKEIRRLSVDFPSEFFSGRFFWTSVFGDSESFPNIRFDARLYNYPFGVFENVTPLVGVERFLECFSIRSVFRDNYLDLFLEGFLVEV